MSTNISNKKVFLTGEWNDLVMVNYQIDPQLLLKFLPWQTELDSFNGKHFVSLVAFMFNDVKIKGMSIPFHTNFPEVNLRFYVRFRSGSQWKRGVVFIREIVPRPAIALVANLLYKEKYASARMVTKKHTEQGRITLTHKWKWKRKVNSIEVLANDTSQLISEGSIEEFITEHYWGYSSVGLKKTNEYGVEHPKWALYPLLSYQLDCDFGSIYGDEFSGLGSQTPNSVFFAVGSPILIREKSVIS